MKDFGDTLGWSEATPLTIEYLGNKILYLILALKSLLEDQSGVGV